MINILEFIKHKQKQVIIGFLLLTIIASSAILVGFARKSITVVIDGTPIKLVTYQKTFDLALKKADITISLKDKIDKALNTKIVNNDIINVTRAVTFKVFVDNKVLNITSAEKDIELMLNAENIVLTSNDKVSTSLKTKIATGMDVVITRVNKETILEKKSIDFKTVINEDKDVLKSQRKVSQDGVKGEKSITINVTYEDGKEVSRKIVKETVVKEPKNKIIVQGTKLPVSVSRGTTSKPSVKTAVNTFKAAPGKILRVKSTAYWAFNGVNNSYTASGRLAVRNPNGISTIAVDPRVIPLGTKLYVEGYGNAIAADTGSSVKGNYIDVFFNTRREAINWGVRYINIKILD